jgi:hypothetical protein
MNCDDAIRATSGGSRAKAGKLRLLKHVAVAAAAATFGVDHAKASKLRSRLRALNLARAQTTSAAEALAHIAEETHDLPLFDRR